MLTFTIPRGMEPFDVAKTFAAYLLGSTAFDRPHSEREEDRFFHGPYRKKEGSDKEWQLDHTNNYWLHIEGNWGTITWRYPDNERVIRAAIALFEAHFKRYR